MVHTRCPYRFYLTYREHWHPRGFAEAQAVGTAFHDGARAIRETGALDGGMLAAERCIAAAVAGEDEETQERATSMVSALVGGYYLHLYRPDVRTVHNEVDLVVPLFGSPEQMHLKCRVDGVVTRLGRPAILLEDKTTSETLDAKEEELRKGPQLPLYVWALDQVMVCKLAGAVAEICKKPVKAGEGACKKKPAETWQQWRQRVAVEYAANPDRYFRRVAIWRDELDVDGAVAAMRQVAHTIELHDATGYPRLRGQCDGKYGPCPYKRLCWRGDTEGYEQRPYEFDGSTSRADQREGQAKAN
jgi:hypothetical protein